MARQVINIGSSANDGTGDPLRTAFDKINDNFVELYGGDNDINTLDANLDVNNFAITTGVTNGNITVTPNGTGNINLGSITINGSQISSNDSTQITLADNIQTTGTINVTGAATLATSLTLATGATVTGILDEDNMATNSATQLATQQSIKAYVDAQNVAQSITFVGDDSTGTAVSSGETFQIAGGTGLTSAVSGDTMTLAIDSTVATLTGSQTLTNKVLTNPTINAATITGAISIDTVSIDNNIIKTNASNANLELDANGTGTIQLLANTTSTGTLTTADVVTTGTHTVTGQSDIDYVRIKDNKITTNATNANLELTANGTGVVDVQKAMTTVGQTVTGNVAIDGQLDIDNISINGNGIIASNSNGGININPNGTGSVTIGGSNVSVPSTLTASTLYAETQILLGDGAKIMPAATNSDLIFETLGTGSVVLEEVSITGNAITTHVSNANLQIGTDGTGTIELVSNTNLTGTLAVTGQLDVDGVRIKDNEITATRTNDNLNISSAGTGSVKINGISIVGSGADKGHITTDDSSAVTFGENVAVQGSITSSSIETPTITRTGDFEIDASGSILLDADSGTISFQDGSAGTFGQVLRSGSNDLTIASGSTQALIFTGANAAFQGNVTSAGTIGNNQITIEGNRIKTTASNADLQLETAGTGLIDIETPTQMTVGAVGAATHLPLDSANEIRPVGYLRIKISGTEYVIPYFNAS